MRAVLALILTLWPLAALAQQSDKDFLTAFLEENLSQAGRVVTITGFEGALTSRASMAEMTIADDRGIWLTVRDVTLDWSRSELLSGRIVVNDFSAGEIVLDRLPPGQAGPSPEAGRFVLPDLPVSIDLGKVAARHILLGEAVLGQRVEGSFDASLQLGGGEGAVKAALTRQDAGPEGAFRLEARYVAATDRLVLDLSAVEGGGGVAVSLLGVPGRPAAGLTVTGEGPLSDFAAEMRLETDGVVRLAGGLRLTGSAAGTTFEADLAGDPTPVFLPDYAEFFGPEVRLQASGQAAEAGGWDLSALRVTTRALSLEGQVRLGADGVPEVLSLQADLGLDGEPVLLPMGGAKTRVKSGRLRLDYDRAEGEAWRLEAALSGLDQPGLDAEDVTLAGQGSITREGGVQVSGAFDFAAKGLALADAAMAEALGTEVTGSAGVQWQGGALQISDLAIKGAGFDLTSQGSLGGLAEGLVLEGRVTGRIDDLARWSGLLARGLRGAAVLDLTGKTVLATGAADVKGRVTGQGLALGMPMLDGLMAGESRLDLALSRDEGGTSLRQLNLALAGASADLSGKITGDGLALQGQVALDDLALLGPGWGGSLVGDLRLSGPLATPGLTLDAKGQDLATGQAILDRLLKGASLLRLDLALEAGGARLSDAALTLEGGETLAAKGRLGAELALEGQVDLADLSRLGLGLRGAMAGDWRFAGPLATGELALEAKARGLATGQPTVDGLLAGETGISAALVLNEGGTRLARLLASGPKMSLEAEGQLGGDRQDIRLTHRLASLDALVPGLAGALVTTGTLGRDEQGMTVDLRSRGPGQIDARITGSLSNDLARADLAIAGTGAAALANPFVAPRSLSGRLRYDLRLRGPLALASLSGPVRLGGGRLADPAQNFGLVDIEATADLGGGQARVAGRARVTSGGSVTANGRVGLAAPYAADVALSLAIVRLRDPELYSTTLDGALTLRGPVAAGAVISGTLNLGRTELRIPQTGFAPGGVLAGLQHRSEPAESRATRQRAGLLQQGGSDGAGNGGGFRLDLRVNAPNQVFIRGRGLDAELGGALTLTGRSDAIVPFGAFNLIRGRLDILGRRLTLSEALLQMQGALVPFVRIAAQVESDGITAQVTIEGQASDPEVRFTSDPDLPEEEVLARLLFDRGLDSLTAFQAIQLASAVATLAGKGGEGVIGNLRRKAGVDNLDIVTDAAGETAVTVGKYISDKAYTEVTVGQGGTSEISLNLDVAPHITVKGRLDSEGQTGIGVFLQRDY